MNSGFVVIGRNEDYRLVECLNSIIETGCPIVYVDSGSSDNSVENARNVGADIVELDMSTPFTAARARNAGFKRLVSENPQLEFVHFIDGDCALEPKWLGMGANFILSHADVAIVCGKLQERFPEASVFNRLCQREWDRPPGETKECGGIALVRIKAFQQAGGYRDSLIAGEEPELCVRLREKGWRIWRLDCVMATHDAAMTRFGQWWKRAMRGGHAFAEVSLIHFGSTQGIWKIETARSVVWGLLLPLAIFSLSVVEPLSLVLFAAYPLQIVRLARKEGWKSVDSWMFASFLVIGKFAEAIGILKYYISLIFRTQSRAIEYK